jgi:uncharacterized membrane protein (GlpM family)
MLLLKLTLVPLFLGLISLAAQRFGPSVAGWLAGLPVVVGPILFLIAIEQGPAFAREAAVYTLASLASVLAWVVTYAWMARVTRAWGAAVAAFLAWGVVASPVVLVPFNSYTATALALLSLIVTPRLFPPQTRNLSPVRMPATELMLRMVVGAALTYVVTTLATTAGPRVSGMLALFPVLTPVLAIFTHINAGCDHATEILRGLSRGIYSLVGFCFALTQTLDRMSIASAFLIGIAAALTIQWLSRQLAFAPKAE